MEKNTLSTATVHSQEEKNFKIPAQVFIFSIYYLCINLELDLTGGVCDPSLQLHTLNF